MSEQRTEGSEGAVKSLSREKRFRQKEEPDQSLVRHREQWEEEANMSEL